MCAERAGMSFVKIDLNSDMSMILSHCVSH